MELLGAGEVHLWFVRFERVDEPLRERCRRVLGADERRRAGRFFAPRHRHAFVVSHALVRDVLSRYAAVPPAAWSFVADERGRPRAVEPALGDVDFNLAHSDTLALVAVARGRVGADVEDLARPAPLEVAGRFFAPSEVQALLAEPPERQPRRFYEYWVLKESYLKARGLGLALPLDRFAFALDGGEPRVSFGAPIDDDPARWWFALAAPTPQHLAAVALRDPPSPPRLALREIVPLADPHRRG